MPRLVLASTSPFRKELLQRLGLEFETAAPVVDERRLTGESPKALVLRLSEAKARAVTQEYPEALIIGSDQVAVIDGAILGKPGDHKTAFRQLKRVSGRRVTFLTGVCLLESASGERQVDFVRYTVHMRALADAQIEHYLQRERPFNCAGSFRSEGLGIALFERMEGDDPTALVGLPLIRLVRMLEHAGVPVL
jgi:MAF protein